MRIATLSALIIFGIDQISKWAVVQHMSLKTLGQIDVLPPFLTFRMAWNRGANFGLLAGHGDLLRWGWVVLALAISIWLVLWLRRGAFSKPAQISVGLLIGGALGNAIDRVIYGAVADFLNMSCCGFNNPYAFNVADIAVFAGAFGLILFTGETKKRT